MTEPNLPKGLVQRKAGAGGMKSRFASTVMGTALFVAEMQRKIPRRTKLLLGVLLLALAAAGVTVYRLTANKAQREARLRAALLLPQAEGAAAVRHLLAEGLNTTSVPGAMDYLGRARDPEAVPLLVAGLGENANAQRAAAVALARIGPPAALAGRDPLAALVAAGGPDGSPVFAWALAVLGDERGVDASLRALPAGRLEGVPTFSLRRLADMVGPARLAELVGDEDLTLRHFAATWLGRHCDASVTAALTRAGADLEESVAMAAAVSLAECATPAALEQAAQVLAAHPSAAPALEEVLAHRAGAVGLGLLLPFAGDAARRIALVRRIRVLHDARAGEVFQRELARDPQVSDPLRLAMVWAMAEVSAPHLAEVAEPLVVAGDVELREGLVEALSSDPGGADVEPLLLVLARDPALTTRVVGALALVRGCSPEAGRLARRRAVAAGAALRWWTACEPERARTLVSASLDPPRERPTQSQGDLRLAVYDAVVRLHIDAAAGPLGATLECAECDPRLRRAAAEAFGQVASPAQLDHLADVMLDARTPGPLRRDAELALRHGFPATAVARLLTHVRSGSDDARTRAAISVLAQGASGPTVAELQGLLDDPTARQNAAYVLALSGEEASVAPLAAFLHEEPGIARRLQTLLAGYRPVVTLGSISSGRFERRLVYLAALHARGVGFSWQRFCEALGAEDPGPGHLRPVEITRALVDLLSSDRPASRRAAAEALAQRGVYGPLVVAHIRGGAGVDAP